MRATDLLPPLLNERHSLRRRRRRTGTAKPADSEAYARALTLMPAGGQSAAAPVPHAPASPASAPSGDLAVARVRSAGGPIDNACYSCACGYVFAAPVSTTVACPRCGAGQAW